MFKLIFIFVSILFISNASAMIVLEINSKKDHSTKKLNCKEDKNKLDCYIISQKIDAHEKNCEIRTIIGKDSFKKINKSTFSNVVEGLCGSRKIILQKVNDSTWIYTENYSSNNSKEKICKDDFSEIIVWRNDEKLLEDVSKCSNIKMSIFNALSYL